MTASTRHNGDRGIAIARLAMWAMIASLLLLPLIAMQFTREVDWTPSDFAAAALLLGGGGIACELVARSTGNSRRRAIGWAVIVAAILLVWAQGAVGIL